MTKLCPRGKAAAKRKFKCNPQHMLTPTLAKICAGKIKDPSGVKEKILEDLNLAKLMGGRVRLQKVEIFPDFQVMVKLHMKDILMGRGHQENKKGWLDGSNI